MDSAGKLKGERTAVISSYIVKKNEKRNKSNCQVKLFIIVQVSLRNPGATLENSHLRAQISAISTLGL